MSQNPGSCCCSEQPYEKSFWLSSSSSMNGFRLADARKRRAYMSGRCSTHMLSFFFSRYVPEESEMVTILMATFRLYEMPCDMSSTALPRGQRTARKMPQPAGSAYRRRGSACRVRFLTSGSCSALRNRFSRSSLLERACGWHVGCTHR